MQIKDIIKSNFPNIELPTDKENEDFAEKAMLLNIAKDEEAIQAFMEALKRLQMQ